jgi:peptidoglycan/xylan/chitin deacetylase (PgdA/CDA1 family)
VSRGRLAGIVVTLSAILLTGCGTAAAGAEGTGSLHAVPSPSPTQHSTVASGRPSGPPAVAGNGPSGTLRTTGSNAVALTFDDGPSPEWTPKYLALLAKYHLHATFCMIGSQVKAHPDLVRQVVAAGDTLCNHTWDHDEYLNQKSAAYIHSEMTRTLDAIRAAAPNAQVPYYRQPGGNWSPTIVAQARSLGMRPVHWNVDPSDWKRPAPSSIVGNIEYNTHAGSIILMHDGGGDRSSTYAALQTLLPWLLQRYLLIRL